MDESKLNRHLQAYLETLKKNPRQAADDAEDRADRIQTYAEWNPERMHRATPDDLVEFFSPLWSMAMWGNKEYQVNQIIADNGLDHLKKRLSDLLWGQDPVSKRWDEFRGKTKWVGPGMMSELLGYVHPDDFIIWNKVTIVALNYLGYSGLPQRSHQIKGESYQVICDIAKGIRTRLNKLSGNQHHLLEVNYLLWDEVHPVAQAAIEAKEKPIESSSAETGKGSAAENEVTEFLHDDVKEKIADIGKWLGFNSRIEVLVSAGSKVDAVWEATIGNMGRVIYVFEVQTHGSIDSLILNLLKSKKNPAVQGVVAISDAKQLDKIRAHAEDVDGLANLTYWDYTDVLKTHERLEAVNETINALNLVPKGFGK